MINVSVQGDEIYNLDALSYLTQLELVITNFELVDTIDIINVVKSVSTKEDNLSKQQTTPGNWYLGGFVERYMKAPKTRQVILVHAMLPNKN